MEVETKKAIFTSDQIIIKKRKQNIVIPLDKVDRMLYAKFTIKNYIENSIHYSVIVQRMDGRNLKLKFNCRYFSFISNGFRDRKYNFRVFNR